MGSKKNVQNPIVNIIRSPKLVNPALSNDNGFSIYSLKNPQKGLGVICMEFLIKINYLGIFWSPRLASDFSNSFLNAGSFEYDEFEINQKLKAFGTHVQFNTNRMYSVISVYSITNQIEYVLPILADFILRPKYPKKVIQNRINNKKKNFLVSLERLETKARREIIQMLYGKLHPYGKMVNEKDFDLIQKEDLIKFHDLIYNSKNFEIIISGDVSDKILSLINENFHDIKLPSQSYLMQERATLKFNKDILTWPFSKEKPIYINKKDALQTAFRIGKIFPGPIHKDFFGLKILITILGGYFGSRLMTKIREEKGYTYGIGAYLVEEEHYSEMHIVTEVGEKYTKLVFDEIIKEIQVLQEKEISHSELERVKSYLLGALLHNSDGIFNQAILFRNLKKNNSSFAYVDNWVEEIMSTNQQKIKTLANQYLNVESFCFVACGPPDRKIW